MLKILHIIPNLRKGGAERLVLDICNELGKKQDIIVKLITFSDQNEYKHLSLNLDWEVVPSSVKLSIFGKNNYAVKNLQKCIEEFKPDIIHSHLFEAEIVSRSCLYPKAKWFSHCHDNMKQFRTLSFKDLLDKRKLTEFYDKNYLLKRYKINGGNHFIAISNDTKNYFARTASNFPVSLLHNAIDYKRFFKEKTFDNHSERCLSLINVGSLSANKNQTFLLDVAEILQLKDISFEMHFLGDGNISASLKEKTKAKNLEKNVYFHGNVTEVENYLWKSDICVHAAKSEALGLTLIEAMAAGLPVITLDGKGNRDLIEQGKNGYMIFEQNALVFAEKIIELWNNKEKYKEMAEFAKDFAMSFDIKQYGDILMNLYKLELIN